ncbi:IQ domain-containing protein E isoform X1 [Dromaius novaehollandiae]|uniref:IQ domain-containing protein E isoform X1 n=1 Tax=Dromaius novaehollandiae TaxID=8790 RepID=UPI00311F129F
MARGGGEAAAEGELGDDSLSVITYESDAEMKLKKKIFHKPPKSPKSPYSSSTQLYPKKAAVWRSLQGAGSAHLESATVKNSRQMWLGSLKQGMNHSLKSDVDMGHVRTNISSSTPEYLKEALGMKKPKHSRSSSNGYVPGTPDYKEKEDMYDEIIELKKTIQAQKNEGDRMKTKLRRLEEENNRKDKQIEQLLDTSRGSELARVLSEKRPANGWVLSALKQKILKLEQQCKEKDNTINQFQTDMKTTDLEEMRTAMETYYEEVHRLQVLLAKSETMRKNTEGRDTQKRLKALNAAVLRLSRNIKELQDENRRLKEDLDQVLSSCPASNKTKNYSEWSKQRLVRRISELEKKVDAMQNTRLSSADSETSQLLAVSSSPSVDLGHSASQQLDPGEECQHLRGLVKKLNNDRRALQNLLVSKESEIKQLLQAKAEADLELQKLQDKKKEKNKEEQTLREEIQNPTQKVGQSEPKFEEDNRQEADDKMEKLNKSSLVCMLKGKEDHRREQAAKLIQRQWKMYRNKKQEIALDETIAVLQAAFRGHLARLKLLLSNRMHDAESQNMHSCGNKNSCMSPGSNSLSLSSDCKEEEEIVTFIQSIFRAHLARKGLLEDSLSFCRPSVFSATSEKADFAINIREKKPISPALKKRSSIFISPLPDDEDSKVMSEEVLEEFIPEGTEKRPQELNLSSLKSSFARSSQKQPRPTLSPSVDEAHSDDSDDIVVVSPLLQMKKNYTHF